MEEEKFRKKAITTAIKELPKLTIHGNVSVNLHWQISEKEKEFITKNFGGEFSSVDTTKWVTVYENGCSISFFFWGL